MLEITTAVGELPQSKVRGPGTVRGVMTVLAACLCLLSYFLFRRNIISMAVVFVARAAPAADEFWGACLCVGAQTCGRPGSENIKSMKVPLWIWFLIMALLPLAGTLALLGLSAGNVSPCVRSQMSAIARSAAPDRPCITRRTAG